ncbi:MAG: zf-TFIIB domain-containing protein [Thermomicrobiales bacterium]
MKCPIDGSELRISERQGIEIDYCPQCRGIWLDRGELDKLLERSAQVAPYTAAPSRDRDAAPYDSPRSADRSADRRDDDRRYRDDDDRRYRDDDDDRYDDRKRKKKRARSFLEDILDFD